MRFTGKRAEQAAVLQIADEVHVDSGTSWNTFLDSKRKACS